MNKIALAESFAKERHKGQKYDNGREYFDAHLVETARIIRAISGDDDLICAAYLHDTLEDTDTTYEELVKNFGERVASLVREVTKSAYNEYPNLKTKEGIMLKFADRLSNLSNMGVWGQEKQEKYIQKSKFWK